MIEPRPSTAQFVEAILRAERTRGGGASDADIAQRVFTRLYQELGKVLGPVGFDVLLARALVLAKRAHPALRDVTAIPGGTLAGLEDTTRDRVALEQGGLAIVAHFIELLVTLIGEDLATRLVGAVWPEAAEEEKR